jgi:hypothetical protein
MIFQCVEKRYAVEIDVDAFLIITSIKYSDYQDDMISPTLCDDLNKIPGLHNIDYNCHFGNYIYFTVSTDDDNEKLRKEVEDCIEKHIQRAIKWAGEMP